MVPGSDSIVIAGVDKASGRFFLQFKDNTGHFPYIYLHRIKTRKA